MKIFRFGDIIAKPQFDGEGKPLTDIYGESLPGWIGVVVHVHEDGEHIDVYHESIRDTRTYAFSDVKMVQQTRYREDAG